MMTFKFFGRFLKDAWAGNAGERSNKTDLAQALGGERRERWERLHYLNF